MTVVGALVIGFVLGVVSTIALLWLVCLMVVEDGDQEVIRKYKEDVQSRMNRGCYW